MDEVVDKAQIPDCIHNGVSYLGKVVGGYRVLAYSHVKVFPSGQKRAYWSVACSTCGNIKTMNKHGVVGKQSQGCTKCVKTRFSCFSSQSASAHWGSSAKHVPGIYFRKTENSAKKRGLPFEVTREQMDDVFVAQQGKCNYTGFDLIFGSGGVTNDSVTTASIDRIDSTKGYVMGNIQWLHKDVNVMKMDAPEELFLRICRVIAENTKTLL